MPGSRNRAPNRPKDVILAERQERERRREEKRQLDAALALIKLKKSILKQSTNQHLREVSNEQQQLKNARKTRIASAKQVKREQKEMRELERTKKQQLAQKKKEINKVNQMNRLKYKLTVQLVKRTEKYKEKIPEILVESIKQYQQRELAKLAY